MSIVRAHMSISLDGFTSGINQSLDAPFGEGTEHFNDWLFRLATIRRMFGQEGGETGPSDDVVAEQRVNIGAVIMGRNMFGGGPGPWAQNPRWDGWWGEEPPYHAPVYVLTHHPRDSLEMKGGTTFHFVTEGPKEALRRAREAAGGQDIEIGGGAHTVQQYLALGALDEIELHLVPMLLGRGDRLFENVPASQLRFETTRVVAGDDVTHLKFRISK